MPCEPAGFATAWGVATRTRLGVSGLRTVGSDQDPTLDMSPSSPSASTAPHPANPNIPARDEYHGVVVTDEYRWLEYEDDPAVRTWTDTHYPAVMLLAGEKDGRVNPANTRKMAARLQQANASDHPILVRLNSAAGHGTGTALSERLAEQADVLAFLFTQLGMPPPASASARDIPVLQH